MKRAATKRSKRAIALKRTPAKVRKFARGLAKKKKRNPHDAELHAAAHMFKKFHGRKPKGVRTVEQTRVLPSVLADLGRMVELKVKTPEGSRLIHFPENTKVRAATTGDGGQLYFVDGDQSISPASFGAAMPKDHIDLGPCTNIVYYTSKDFHNFKPSEYTHRLGEEGGFPPTLHYDVHSKRLYLTGGSYRVKREGIVN